MIYWNFQTIEHVQEKNPPLNNVDTIDKSLRSQANLVRTENFSLVQALFRGEEGG